MFRVRLEHITKVFSRRSAVSDVSLEFSGGVIYGLLGENGAGKSTLVHILAGLVQPTDGKIFIGGTETVFRGPGDAAAKGIAIVHQRPLLSEDLTVWENCVLGCEPSKAHIFISKRKAVRKLRDIADKWNMDIRMEDRVSVLSADQRLYAAVLAALYRKPELLILDEPSAALAPEQRDIFFTGVRRAAQQGLAVILITHNLEEAKHICTSISVLREGRLAGTVSNTDHSVPERTLHYLIFENACSGTVNCPSPCGTDGHAAETGHETITEKKGPKENPAYSAAGARHGEKPRVPALCVRNLTVRAPDTVSLHGVSFDAHAGEITVITGQRESGMETLEDVLSGMHRGKTEGTVSVNGQNVSKDTPAKLRKKGVGIVPSDRTFRGSDPGLTVYQMLIVHRQSVMRRGPFLDEKKLRAFVIGLISGEQIQTTPDSMTSSLSGGMLQRLILARELAETYDLQRTAQGTVPVLILAEPSWGLDAQTTSLLWRKLYEAALSGAAVIVLSADTEIPYEQCGAVYRMTAGILSRETPCAEDI